ncbi:MAG: response regulator [Verrucomicrobia bacterium]|nr:response regulator [Verrucomicrobiota bacterium]
MPLSHLGVAVFFGATSVHLARSFGRSVQRVEQQAALLATSNDQLREAHGRLEKSNAELGAAKQEAERSREEAVKASQWKSAFLANMSHELRTPLNAIIGYAELLREEAPEMGAAAIVPDLDKIHSAARHQLALINDILDMSKIEAGKMTLFVEEFSVARLLEEVRTIVAPLIERRQNAFRVAAGPELSSMRSDQTKVRQILFNLLSNAAKFTENGKIELQVQAVAEDIVFTVTDTGIGMNADQMNRLFQAFTQAEAAIQAKYGGTGLGLAISQKFCEMMGGDIRAQSTVGQGSIFTVRLPRQIPEFTPPPKPSLSASPARGRILAIDDDAQALELLQRLLSREGYEVAVARSGSTGLELAAQWKPDLITLDVLMPGMDGWTVLGALRSTPALASIPVVMMTVLDDKQLAFSLGAADFLTKPVDGPKLQAALERHQIRASATKPVLIIDDDPDARQLLRRLFEREGWTVREASNGQEGLESAQSMPPRLIILDLMMPVMDGFQFLERWLVQAHHELVPVIVVTSKDLSLNETQQLQGTVQQVLRKGGFDSQELLARIRGLFAAKQMLNP